MATAVTRSRASPTSSDAAVRRLQQARGLTVDGIVGPQTQAAVG